jgi:aldose 1-epimerase
MPKGRFSSHSFGTLRDGREVTAWSHTTDKSELCIINYGASIAHWRVKVGGFWRDILIPCSNAEEAEHSICRAATIGRFANRIKRGRFTLGDSLIQLSKNDGQNHLHGGTTGFDRKIWSAECTEDELTLTCLSPDGEEGYPGELRLEVTFRIINESGLEINYRATSTQDTVVNFTNHAYFNLSEDDEILDHLLHINAAEYQPVDSELIPLNGLEPVDGSVFDFRKPRRLREGIEALDREKQLQLGNGYDHNYKLLAGINFNAPAATLQSPLRDILLSIYTTLPGCQLYTGNHLTPKHRALCLETQHFPDSPNRPDFPSTVLRKGEAYKSCTRYMLEY